MSDLRQAAQQALKVLENDIIQRTYPGGVRIARAAIDLRAALAEQTVHCEPQQDVGDGWCEWVCPTPTGYLMECCDCGLIHELEFRVARYEPRPSEEFVVVDDPNMQAQFRVKRRDDLKSREQP